MNRRSKEALFFNIFRGCALFVVIVLVVILGYILINGVGKLSIDLFTQNPAPNSHGAMVAGGILSPIVGTLMLMAIVLIIAVPAGVFGAVFLVEYGGNNRISRAWWMIVNNLAGVPSIVWGLVGVGLLVYYLNFGLSLLAAGVTLSFVILPLIMVATKEAIEAIPPSIREASVALGATKWQTVRHHILPYSASGILTGIILSLSRAAGETAPILLTGVAVNAAIPSSLSDSVQALPYYIYLMTQTSDRSAAIPMAYAAALVLIGVIVLLNLGAIILRNRYRQKYRW
ncbi:MAG: phosphate transporter permease subunit PtsA [Methanomassiliicoccales archaeon PtaU1.Bin124]|nr:MAG: phosphate transporter permease subunit PtsA [Methanomassiliicoccales archaeon PtaU1.Bin124]